MTDRYEVRHNEDFDASVFDTREERRIGTALLAQRLNEAETLRWMFVPVPREGEDWWKCIIGPCRPSILQSGADLLMREAVRGAYLALTGRYPEDLSSSWGAAPSALQREVADEANARLKIEGTDQCPDPPEEKT